MRYKPPTQVNVRFSVEYEDACFLVVLYGYLTEGGPEIEKSMVWVDYPDSKANLLLAPGLTYDEVVDRVSQEEIIKAFNIEYEGHYTDWGDHVYESHKDRDINKE